jgi:hypothetical protein
MRANFPREDLNPHKQIQSLPCYHYTTGEWALLYYKNCGKLSSIERTGIIIHFSSKKAENLSVKGRKILKNVNLLIFSILCDINNIGLVEFLEGLHL